jgi:hypothetical protein
MARTSLHLKTVERLQDDSIKAVYEARHYGKMVLTLDVVVTVTRRVEKPVVASISVDVPGTESVPESLQLLGDWLGRIAEALKAADPEASKFTFPAQL